MLKGKKLNVLLMGFIESMAMIICGTGLIGAVVYFAVNSPKKKALAEVYKQQKLKELAENSGNDNQSRLILENLKELRDRVDHLDQENQRLIEENQFLKRIADK